MALSKLNLMFSTLQLLVCGALVASTVACGGSSSTIASVIPAESSTTVSASTSGLVTGQVQNGQVVLAESMPATVAGNLIVYVASTNPPETIAIQEATLLRMQQVSLEGYTAYTTTLDSALVQLDAFNSFSLNTEAGTAVAIGLLSSDQDTTTLIYEGNPNTVTVNDVALALATIQLGPTTAEALAERASALLDAPGFITAANLNPVPSSENLDYIRSGSGLTIADLAGILARLQVQTDDRVAIATRINELLDTPGVIGAADVRLVPGTSLPGPTIELQSEINEVAGNFQVSVFVPLGQLATDTFTLDGLDNNSDPATSTFVRSSLELFPGFTSFSADIASTFNTIQTTQLLIDGVSNTDCVIVHSPGQAPEVLANQLAASFACGADF